MKKPAPLAKVLPADAAKLLQAAAQTPLDKRGSRIPRLVAIERAVAQVQHQYPHLFKKD
jgi:hypothetical protein